MELGGDSVSRRPTPVQIISNSPADAAAYNNAHPNYGYQGDPLRPVEGKYYGYLVRAGEY